MNNHLTRTIVALGCAALFSFVLGRYLGWPWPSRQLNGFVDLGVFEGALVGYVLMFAIVFAPFWWVARLLLFTDPNNKGHRDHGSEIPPVKWPNAASIRTT